MRTVVVSKRISQDSPSNIFTLSMMIRSVAKNFSNGVKQARDVVSGLPGFQLVLRELALRDMVHPWITAQVQPKGVHPVWTRNGMRFLYSGVPDDLMARRIVWSRFIDIDGTMSLLSRLLPPRGTLVDVGAYSGAYTLAALADVSPAYSICIEPNPESLVLLRRNLGINGLGNSVDVHGVAVSDEEGQSTLYVPRDKTCSSLESTSGSHKEFQVNVRTMDSLLAGRAVDVIKIDTEGHEPRVLRGSSETISSNRPAVIVEILTGSSMESVVAEMKRLGSWKLWWAGPKGLEPSESFTRVSGFPNFVFLPKDKQTR